ncbi:MAG: hypothetical protein GEU82_01390 [Luteitalea sp.]|nr:hypothetical protein [Luteitalea sp.]
MDVLSLALEAAPKALVYAATMLAIGACVARALFRLRVTQLVAAGDRHTFESALTRVVVAAAAGLVVALALRAWAHTAAAFGLPGSFSWENLYLIAAESRWGESWQKQIAASVVLVIFTRMIEPWRRIGWWLTALGSLTLCYLLPLLGHAAGQPSRVFLHGSHILGGGVWLGTLVSIAMAARIGTGAGTLAARWPPVRRQMLAQFSPVAFAGSALLVVTGAVAVWSYLGAIGNLLAVGYGRLLLLKLVLVVAVGACGFSNWRRLRLPPTSSRWSPLPGNLVAAEIALAITVVLVTAVLTETEHP